MSPEGAEESVSFALSGLRVFRFVPRADVLGYILAPLRGFGGGLVHCLSGGYCQLCL